MGLFNVVFLKKLIFSSSLISLSATPLIIIRKYGFFSGDEYVSKYKKEWIAGVGYGDGNLEVNEFAKTIFKTESMYSVVDEIFVKDIARQILASSGASLHRKILTHLQDEEEKNYQTKLDESQDKNKEQRVWDDNGGTKQSTLRRWVGDKSFEFFKKSILDFDNGNFALNKYADKNQDIVLKSSFYVSKEELSDQSKWKNIGFYPVEDQEYKNNPDLKTFYKEKFKFLNWAHKEWFQDIRPFYTWMSLWKYKEKATEQELSTYWDKAKAGVDISKASYEFPYFETQDQNGVMSSTSKFKKFFKNVVPKDINKDIYIPREYTDDNATSILVEGSNMYSNLFVKFAAAANYKYSAILKKTSESNGGNSASQNPKNQKEKNHSVDNYEQPFELFFPENGKENESKAIKINKEIHKKSDWKDSKDKVTDIVEIKDTPWVFIRNSAGIHALAVDSYSVDKYKTNGNTTISDIYNHFNFRTLQLVNKDKGELKNTNTLDLSSDAALKSFKTYLEQKFATLFLRYSLSETNSGSLFKPQDQTINLFKESLEKRSSLSNKKEEYKRTLLLRQALIREYAKSEWESEGNKFKNAAGKYGLAGVLPYDLNTEPVENKKSELFKELENIYSTNFSLHTSPEGSSKSAQNNQTLLEEFKKAAEEYATTVEKFVQGLQLRIDPVSTVVESDRIFSTNYFMNWFVDKFLDNKEAFETYLFKYHLESNYIKSSLLGSQSFIKSGDELITVPDNYKDDKDEQEWFDLIDKPETDSEKIKKVYGKIVDQLKSFYYSKLVFEDSNPWELLKYSGSIAKKDGNSEESKLTEKLTEKLTKLANTAFEEMLYFDTNGFKNRYYKFLSGLICLTNNNFEGLRKYMSLKITRFDEAWIIINGKKSEKELASIPNVYWTSPFLNPAFTSTADFETKTTVNPDKYLKQLASSGFAGIYIPSSSDFGTLVSSKYTDKFITKKLFKYGSSAEEMDKFVKNISTESDLKAVIRDLKAANPANAKWLDAIGLDHIYIEDSGTTTYRSLTLQEKKNLVSAVLNNVKIEINSSKIEKSKYKDVFLADPNKSYTLTGEAHTKKTSSDSSYEDNKLGDHFKSSPVKIHSSAESKDENLIFGGIQINSENFSSLEKLKSFANNANKDGDKVGTIKGKQIFWGLVLELATRFDVQEMALEKMVGNKIKVYDGKVKESANSRYVAE